MDTPNKSIQDTTSLSSEKAPVKRLYGRYRRTLFIVVLPLFIIITVLAANQYHDQQAQVVANLRQTTSSYAFALDGIAKQANDHVLQLKAWSENYLTSPPSYPSDLRNHFKPKLLNGQLDAYTLDGVPNDKRAFVGQLVWNGQDPRQTGIGDVSIDQALEFFSLARLTHDVSDYFQWSYFFSTQLNSVAVYPWFSTEEILAASGMTSLRKSIDKWFEYEIYQAGTPQKNPERKTYWTAPYIDAGGTGAMVSLGAPVYLDNEFHGIVGTDVKLITLERFLQNLKPTAGRLLILNKQQMLLADSNGVPPDTIMSAAELFPNVFGEQWKQKYVQDDQEYRDTNGHILVTQQTRHAPWILIYLVSHDEMLALLFPRLLPYAVILATLIATLFIAINILRKHYIAPALSLVEYIHDASTNPTTQEPSLPRLWQKWADLISNTFKVNHRALQMVRESEERLQQILNNSSAVVYVRDVEDRFILVNQPFERLLDTSSQEVLGKKLHEVFPQKTADEFRANDLQVIERNTVLEFEETVTFDDGLHTYISNKFPLYDSNGDIYAVCGISTDITERKRAEEALRQSALGISKAHGKDLFDTLVSYLSQATNTDYAPIGVLEGKDHIRTRALYAKGKIQDNITYPLQGSPCNNVIGQKFRFYSRDIQQLFPEDELLVEIGADSYAAIPLFDSADRVLGLLAILDSRPLRNQALTESLLKIFSGRAASELERERTDNELRESEISYREIFETSEACIFVHDIETGAILDVNKSACSTYGYSKAELRNIDVGQLSSGVPPYTLKDAARLIERAIDGEKLHFEWHRKNRDGSLHWDEVYLRRASIGGQDRILAFTREITARKEAEAALQASEEQYRSIFQATSDALILWDSTGQMVDANPAAWHMAGYSKQEFFSKPFHEIIHPDSMDAYNRYRTKALDNKASSMEIRAIRKDGTVIDLESRSIPMPYRGQPHLLSITRDITEQKRIAEELARQREVLRQSEKLSAMGELLASVAHELNNPLAILMGRTALLESKVSDEAIRSDVQKINMAADRCGRIVSTFLSMARQKPPEMTHANLNQIVTSAVDLLAYALRTADIALVMDLDEDLPESLMDADQIGQIIINLLVNAQHVLEECSPPRRIWITTGQRDDRLFCRIGDNGPGIAEEIKPRIFDPFFTTKEADIGTGIGLSVSQGIARDHGGELCLEENEQGALFVLWLDLKLSDKPVIERPGADGTHRNLQEHILIVDDESEISELLQEILESAGLMATRVSSGREALDWLENHQCDILLCDIRMPDMDGSALWRILRQDYSDLAAHTAFITGDTLSANISPFLKETARPCLEKPFTPEQVLELVAGLTD